MHKPVGFFSSIQVRLVLSNLLMVGVLVALSVTCAQQFAELGRTINTVSAGAELMLHLGQIMDEREPALLAVKRGYTDGKDEAARSKLTALLDDAVRHLERSQALAPAGEELALVSKALTGTAEARRRLAESVKLGEDEALSAATEGEEQLEDAFGSAAKAKLLTSKGMEQRLALVRAALERPMQLLWVATGVGVAIAIAILLYTRARVSSPIRALSEAVADLQSGKERRLSAGSSDELGRLALSFNQMAATITDRTKSLQLVLDNVGDGLLTANLDGTLAAAPSARAGEWFGVAADGVKFWDYLARAQPELAGSFHANYLQLVEETLPFELCAEQMPRELEVGGRAFELAFREVRAGTALDRVLIVVTDVTEARRTAKAERKAREVFTLSCLSLRDPDGYVELCHDVELRLARAKTGTDVMLELHTLKGNVGVMGLDDFAQLVHQVESDVEEHAAGLEPILRLENAWNELKAAVRSTVGRAANEHVAVPKEDVERLEELVGRAGILEAQRLVRSWSMHDVGTTLRRLAETTERFARRVGKRIHASVRGAELMVAKGRFDELWACLAHLAKNSVAHGVELPEERSSAGKPTAGHVLIEARRERATLELLVRDDGAGIDWERLQQRTGKQGRGVELFLGEAVKSDTADIMSGRGVGVAAVHAAVVRLGGKLEVSSELGKGTEFRVVVPLGMEEYFERRSEAPGRAPIAQSA